MASKLQRVVNPYALAPITLLFSQQFKFNELAQRPVRGRDGFYRSQSFAHDERRHGATIAIMASR